MNRLALERKYAARRANSRDLVVDLPSAQFRDSSQGHQLRPDSRRKALGPPDIQRFPERRCGLGKPALVNFEQADLIEQLAAELDLLPATVGSKTEVIKLRLQHGKPHSTPRTDNLAQSPQGAWVWDRARVLHGRADAGVIELIWVDEDYAGFSHPAGILSYPAARQGRLSVLVAG